MEILVLADTHLKDDFNQLPVEVKKKINKVDLVLHAGDFKTLKFYNSLILKLIKFSKSLMKNNKMK